LRRGALALGRGGGFLGAAGWLNMSGCSDGERHHLEADLRRRRAEVAQRLLQTSPKWFRIQSRAKECGTPIWNAPSLMPSGRTCLNQVRNSVSEIWSRTCSSTSSQMAWSRLSMPSSLLARRRVPTARPNATSRV
jgi:hypothetical protein